MKSEPRKINGMLKTIVEAINHYNTTGKHKQVVFRYKAEQRTPFDFSHGNMIVKRTVLG